MHLARPKSSKGRSRPPVSSSLSADDMDYSPQRPPGSPDLPEQPSRDRNLRSQSQPVMWQTLQLSQDGVSEILQPAPAPPQSLNKYKVLPSIERRPDLRSLDTHMSKLHLCDEQRDQDPLPVSVKTCIPERDTKGPSNPGLHLLLAIRAPCGRRFQHHFDPTDTLLRVKSTAELEYGVQYGEVSIETMEVPRRTFRDMRMTLAECGIMNRSVLCISEQQRAEV